MSTELSPELTALRKIEFEDVDRYLAERRKTNRADDEAWSPAMRARMIANQAKHDEQVCQDLDLVLTPVSKTVGWLDTNGCQNSFHCFSRDEEGRIVVCHSDDSVCDQSEYKFPV